MNPNHLRALVKLLLDTGDLTPVGARMLLLTLDEEPPGAGVGHG